MQNYYDENAELFYESTLNVDMRNIYERFLPHIPRGSLIIDAGCGSGRDSLFFKNKGYEVEAFDASSELAKKASDLLGKAVKVSTFESFTLNNKANGVWCCASLLHVPRSKLQESISNLEGLLKSQGVMYVSFKYGETERNHDGRYFTDMNEKLLAQLLSKFSNLAVLDVWVTGDNRPGRENEKWLNAILKKS